MTKVLLGDNVLEKTYAGQLFGFPMYNIEVRPWTWQEQHYLDHVTYDVRGDFDDRGKWLVFKPAKKGSTRR